MNCSRNGHALASVATRVATVARRWMFDQEFALNFIPPHLLQVERSERWPVALSFAWFFHLLMSYYVLRPVRETMSVKVGGDTVAQLFQLVFLVMLAAVPVYAFLAARLRRRWLVAVVYQGFACCLVGFWSWLQANHGEPTPLAAKCFFVWVSVYNLFVVSVFWSFMADVFCSDQAKRLFPFMAAGGTLGGICGSALAASTASRLGTAQMLLIAALFLEVCIGFAFVLGSRLVRGQSSDPTDRTPDDGTADERTPDGSSQDEQPAAGGMWEGLRAVAANPYLQGICGFVFLGKLCATVVYYQQIEIVGEVITDKDHQTQLFARVNLVVQVITLVLQTIVTARLFQWIGLTATLVILPATYLVGFTVLGLTPRVDGGIGIFWVLMVVEVAHRAIAYGVIVPAREVLFTVVSRAEKYQSKNFIDTVVWRGGDVVSSEIYQRVSKFGASVATTSWLLVPVAALWMVGCVWLGRHYQRLAMKQIPERVD